MDTIDLSLTMQPGDEHSQAGSHKIAQLMNATDWSRTPLGPVSGWSQSLRTALSICLNSRFPILIWWGPQLIMLYNDAYRPILGATKHPRALGQAGAECWPEIWHIIGPMLQGVITTGQATWSEDQLLLLDRNGFLEECYFTFSYSPILDENGIGGVFTAVTETTGQVVSERRMRTLAELSARFSGAHNEDEICRSAIQALGQNPHDLPFTALYLFHSGARHLRLAGQTGLAQPAPAEEKLIQMAGLGGQDWTQWAVPRLVPVDSFLPGEALYRALDLDPALAGIQPVTQMKALPVGTPDSPLGLLMAGLSPYRQLDDDYHAFLALVAGEISSALATARALEAEHKRAEALAELDRAKTEFFSNISHEFRTPITLMLGPAQDALNEEDGSLSPANRERFMMVHRNGLRLLKLVNSLLDFSRIEAGRIKAIFQPVDLAEITRDLAGMFRSTIEHAGLEFHVDCLSLPEPVYIDLEMWEKIVLNLISNAFKFTFTGQIDVSLTWKEQFAELCVTDTGTGISPEKIPQIFERFRRVDGAQSRSVEGSGIGLALVQELVRLHGGSLTVTSAPGEGSSFCVSLPTGKDHLPKEQIHPNPVPAINTLGALPFVEEARRWLPDSPSPLSPVTTFDKSPEIRSIHALPRRDTARVLLADDNADVREYLRRLLSERWLVETTTDGLSALAAIHREKPDLLLADVMMPGMNGFELLSRLREDPATRDIQVILLSARAGEEARVEGLELGADDYLVKPFSARELIARVESRLILARMRSELQRRITGILKSMTDAFWALDGDWQVTLINPTAERLSGGDLHSGNDARPFLRAWLLEEHWILLERAMQERTPAAFEYHQATHGAWYGIRVYPYESGMAIIAADITFIKTGEETQRALELQRRLLEHRENERQEIAREIHDGPIQSLISTMFNAQFAKEAVQDQVALMELEQINLSIKSAVRELREVVNHLRPPALIRFGLAKAIRVNVVDLQEKHPEWTVHLDLHEEGPLLPEPVCLALYRIFQEAMNNIARHAHATQIWVRYHRVPDTALLEIKDNGQGFKMTGKLSQTAGGHFGLAGMKERADTIQGQLEVKSTPGRGTTLRIIVPVAAPVSA